MRQFIILACLTLIASPALAGFEWIPPAQTGQAVGDQMKRQNADAALAPNWQAESQGYNPSNPQAPASVESMPLSNDAPTSLFPASQQEIQQARQSARPKQNLSGKALVIDPYPLRKGAMAPPMQGVETYKAMQEQGKKLHPVRLGSGYSTGAKPKAIPFPQPLREASVAKRSYKKVPDINMGITPMVGGDSAPLPRTVNKRVVPTKNDNMQYAQAIGFGQDLPLALALSQVVPAEFSHSFAKNVDAGVTVSWEGGKAWNLVLNDMLRSKNLTAVIQGNQVIIQPMASL